MDIKNIRLLAKILNESELSAIEVCEKESKIRLERNLSYTETDMPIVRKTVIKEPVIEQKEPEIAGSEVNFNNLTEVKSPMIGVFYAAASPNDKPFAEVGKKVKKGDVLCIIEAMKVMNEIIAEDEGEIVDICAQNGQLVEYSQVLFKIF